MHIFSFPVLSYDTSEKNSQLPTLSKTFSVYPFLLIKLQKTILIDFTDNVKETLAEKNLRYLLKH